ncbi:transposase [bacterium]|nr:transposase [bacterium]
MLDESTRAAILALHERGHGAKSIAMTLHVSRWAVKEVLRLGTAQVPLLKRAEKAEPYRDEILEQYTNCKGNLVRVHEEIVAQGADLSYQALTAFCRRHGIGHEPKKPAGQYHFLPGQEMQHDTSPHVAVIGGKKRRVQTASLVLCFSRMRFIQLYPTFNRFWCKVFLTAAIQYFGGACGICMIDNTSVIVLRGTGAEMVPVPEMEAFGQRFGFEFAAHEKGDANRSAHVEVGFDHVDNNFLAGREFDDWAHANREAVAWCDRTNAAFSRKLHASRRELFATEQVCLEPLPIWIPQVYTLHQRIVDIEGYVTVHTNRYTVPYPLISRRVEVRETQDRIEVYDGPRKVAEHDKVIDARGARVLCKEHRPPRGQGRSSATPCPEEQALLSAEPGLADYVAALKKKAKGRGVLPLRKLLSQMREYPRAPFLEAVRKAAHYGMYDLDRIERMVLRNIAREYFVLPIEQQSSDNDTDGGKR